MDNISVSSDEEDIRTNVKERLDFKPKIESHQN